VEEDTQEWFRQRGYEVELTDKDLHADDLQGARIEV
jgi:hypothetical protein